MTAGNILIKMDDILVDTTPTRYRLIRKRWSRFNRWFIDFGPQNNEDVYKRKFENIYEWLLKPLFRRVDYDTFINVILAIEGDFNDHVNSHVYENANTTDFAKRSVYNPLYIDSAGVNTIYILYDYSNDIEKQQKEELIGRLFNNKKIIPVGYSKKTKLSDVLKEKNISWNLFVTDSVTDVQDVAENCNRERKEFLLPKYGYVDLPEKVAKLISYDYGSVNYYDPFKKN